MLTFYAYINITFFFLADKEGKKEKNTTTSYLKNLDSPTLGLKEQPRHITIDEVSLGLKEQPRHIIIDES